MKKLILIATIALASTVAYAHSGGTDASGCHLDHRTGIYHCH
jgi:hypothetical protein